MLHNYVSIDFYNGTVSCRFNSTNYLFSASSVFIEHTNFPFTDTVRRVSYEPDRNLYVVEELNGKISSGLDLPVIVCIANNLTNNVPQSAFTSGNPSQLIQTKDPRPLIQTPDTVKDVLNRLHNREKDLDTIDTQDETTTNNDRLLSDMSASESKKKGKKKPLMKIE